MLTMSVFFLAGLVSESASKVAKNREDLGTVEHHGGVWSIRCDGATFTSASRNNLEKC